MHIRFLVALQVVMISVITGASYHYHEQLRSDPLAAAINHHGTLFSQTQALFVTALTQETLTKTAITAKMNGGMADYRNAALTYRNVTFSPVSVRSRQLRIIQGQRQLIIDANFKPVAPARLLNNTDDATTGPTPNATQMQKRLPYYRRLLRTMIKAVAANE